MASTAGETRPEVPGGHGLTREQAILLLRWLAARDMLERTASYRWGKYLFLAFAGVAYVADVRPLAVGALTLFLLVAAIEWSFRRAVRWFGAIARLTALEEIAEDAKADWWASLRREMSRVGLPTSRWRWVWPGTWRSVTAVTAIDWDAAIAGSAWQGHWNRARQILADATLA
jgi:hypothetical protein